MKLTNLIVILILMASCSGQRERVSDQDQELKVGFGVVDITGEDAYVLDPLNVKALVIRQGDIQVAMIACDAGGVSKNLTDPLREQLSQETGIPAANIVIAATHTHMANARKDLEPAILKAVVKAQASLKPVQVQSVLGQQFNISFHRRYFMKDGSVVFNPMFLNPDIVRPVGIIDPEVNYLLFRDASTGSPYTSVASFALHLDIVKEYGAVYQVSGPGSPNAVSADYPYWLEEFLREDYGRDFNSLFFQGACGDINHWDFSKPGPQSGHAKAREVGDSLYRSIKRAMNYAVDEIPKLEITSKTIDLPLQTFSEKDLEWAINLDTAELSGKSEEPDEREQFLNSVRQRRILWLYEKNQNGINTMPVEVQAIRLGDNTAIIALPGEIFVELGLTIKNHSPFENTFVISLANNTLAYVPNRKAFNHGGYEVENSRLARGSGEIMVETAIELLRMLKEI